jgi:ABC-2 type transport system ATP-binding protein
VGLDPNQIREIRELITELGKEHGIILCTHILPEVQAVCNRVQIINEGKLVYEANMDQLLDKQETGSYEVALLNPPSINDLNNIDGVNNVERLHDNSFLFHLDENSVESLTRAAVENGWGLNKLVPHKQTLEQIFVELTLGEADNNTDMEQNVSNIGQKP